MRSTLFGGLATFILAATGVHAAIKGPVEVRGNAFYVGNERWYIRGVDYQPGGASSTKDPLGDPEQCKRDIKYFQDLGINAIRVYAVDNKINHDDCMQQLADAGIYLILDVNTGRIAINRASPEDSYNAILLQHIFATIDAFKGYTNTAMFFSANEVINDDKTTGAATIVKAVTRDMKEYISKQSKRKIPVGYSAADVESNRVQMAQYLNCGDDEMARTDFFAFNDYSWCGTSGFQESGYDKKVETFKDYSVPIFLSEYGCNEIKPRVWAEVESIYSENMTPVYSGGLAYEFTMEDNQYGLAKISGNTVTTNQDFDNLKAAFEKTKNASGDGGAKSSGKPSECPPQDDKWQADNKIPDMPKAARQYIDKGAGKALGNMAPTNMDMGYDARAPTEPGQNSGGSTNDNGTSSNKKGDASGFRPSIIATGLIAIAAGFFSL